MPWFKPTDELIMMLTLCNARRAQAGLASPIAAKVLERLEGAK